VRAEEAVRESEVQLRLITDNVPAMIAYSDTEHRYRYANRRFIEFYGGAGAVARGRTVRELVGEETWRLVRGNLERALSGEALHYEGVRRDAAGRARNIEATLVPDRDEAGRVRGVYTFILDITERRAAEQAIREGLAQLKLITDNVPAMIAYYDRDMRCRYANRAYQEFYAPGADSIVGRTALEILGAETWEHAAERAARALAGETLNFRRRERRADGRKRDIEITLVPHRAGTGQVLGLYALVLDVTERWRAERALRLRERAIESSTDAIMITEGAEEDFALVYVNAAFERITGYAAAEVLGRNPRFLHREDRAQAGLRDLRAAVRDEREANALLRNYRKDGTPYWSELRIAPVRDDRGRTTHYVGVSSDVSERVRSQEALERQANYDALTGLPNRNLMRDRLAQALVQARRGRQRAAVLYVDLDHVKRINDSLGHPVGDKVIASSGARIAGVLRSGDTVARVGGDEFVAILPVLKYEHDAALVAQKLREAIAAPLEIDGHQFVLSASVGIAVFPKDGEDSETLLRNADAALYRAKEEGRDCERFFTAELNQRVVRHLQIEGDLRRALEREEFRLHYQPIVELATRRVAGFEALARWPRPGGTWVPPAEFIPVAEDSGLIVALGRWVMLTAAREVRKWNGRGKQPRYVSINLSARQFKDPQLLDTVREALRGSGADPSHIRLEITESTVMSSADEAIKTLRALRALGVRISVDDFGTGYSSLSYLKRFPINTLKIDRSFVRDLASDADDLKISRAVIDLAHGLGLEVVAEGVETRTQASILARYGCDGAQGYLFGKPVEGASIEASGAGKARRPSAGRGAPAKRAGARTRKRTARASSSRQSFAKRASAASKLIPGKRSRISSRSV
jgi:diguanylate cyclase (GGDEF)-like protein/PAS domain S-box-containing protein